MYRNLEKVQSVYGNLEAIIGICNACDKAYSEGTGNPDWYSPFDQNNPEKVAINMAALPAVISGLSIIAVLRGMVKKELDEYVLQILSEITKDKLSIQEKSIMLRLANLSWNSGQSFRDMISNPLGRIKKMNVFDLLPPDEVAKDWHQIKAASQALLAYVTTY